MDTPVRATCPGCRTVLRIPAAWVGQAVKCKKCGALVRSKPRDDAGGGARVDTPGPAGANAFDFSAPADDDFPLPEPVAPAAGGFDPTAEPDPLPQPVPYPVPQPPPGYAYPAPPGYPPGAYAPPPGYPYGPPPGYPYAPPPGYPYPYPAPPGYPPGAYAPPTGYPYGPPAAAPGVPPSGTVPYPAPQAPTAPSVPVPQPVARVPAPSAPVVHLPPAAPAKPGAAGPLPVVPRPPDPVAPSSTFRPDTPVVSAGRRYRRASGKGTWVWVGLCLLLAGGLMVGGLTLARHASERSGKPKDTAGAGDGKADGSGAPAPQPAAKAAAFPRRMLFVSISRYMFLNPLTYAEFKAGSMGGDVTKAAAVRLANEWSVPYDPKDPDRNQLYLLSDTARPDKGAADPPVPVRNVVVGAYEQFFATSRAQDRVVVYFGGHALEVGGKAYLAPLDGDPDDPEPTLIPVADFYDKLKACKATQRVVVWDVCRLNPQKGVPEAPGSGPMPEGLAKALLAAPPGVEVVLTCQPGENALEFDNAPEVGGRREPGAAGSAFLDAARYAAARAGRQSAKQPTPADPIPVADWAAAAGRRVADVASSSNVGLKQTVRADGKPPAAWAASNPDEPPAKRFELPAAPKGTSAAEVSAIAAEFSLPPISTGRADIDFGVVVFRDEVMREYRSDVTLDQVLRDKATYKFQAKTFEAMDKIRSVWTSTGGPVMRNDFPAPVTDALKKDIKGEQDFWALGGAELEVLNGDLDALLPLRAAQPKRWQAHYDYARAVLKARLAYMNEYNKLLGDVLTETLPAAKPGGAGYRRVTSDKLKSRKEIQQLAEEAKEIYAKIVTEHKGTPWAVRAKREKSFPLGLAWQAVDPPAAEKPTP
jgi:hypothetical protein